MTLHLPETASLLTKHTSSVIPRVTLKTLQRRSCDDDDDGDVDDDIFRCGMTFTWPSFDPGDIYTQ